MQAVSYKTLSGEKWHNSHLKKTNAVHMKWATQLESLEQKKNPYHKLNEHKEIYVGGFWVLNGILFSRVTFGGLFDWHLLALTLFTQH